MTGFEAARCALIVLGAAGSGLAAGLLGWQIAAGSPRFSTGLRCPAFRRPAPERLPRALERILEKREGIERPAWAEAWIAYAGPRLESAGLKIAPMAYFVLLFSFAAAGFSAGAAILDNPLAGALLAVMAVLIPEQVVGRIVEAGRMKLVAQLGPAAQMFGAEMAESHNVISSLASTAKRVPEPMRGVLRECVLDLQAGVEPARAFTALAKRLDFDYGRMFAQLLLAAIDDVAVIPSFARLATRVASHQTLAQKNAAELAWMRLVGVVLNVAIVPAVVLVSFLVPTVGHYLLREPMGRVIVDVALLSVIVGLVLDRTLHKVAF